MHCVRLTRMGSVIASTIAVCLAAVAIGACGGGGDDASNGAASSSGAAGSGGVPANADPQLKKIYDSVVAKQMPGVPFSVLAEAKKEGQVSWYHLNLPDATKALTSAFKKHFPFIKINEYASSGDLLFEKFISEQRAGSHQADVLSASAPEQIEAADKEGYIEHYKLGSESSFQPATFASGVWYAFARPTLAVYAYNSNSISPAQAKTLSTYQGLWSKELGDVPMNIYTPLQSTGARLYFYYIKKSFGDDSWTALAAKNPKFADSVASLSQLQSGETSVLVTSEGSALAAYNSGAPIRWTVPEPALGGAYPEAIVAKAPHPAAAKLLHEFILSKEGQKIFARLAEPSARTDVGEQRAPKKESWFTPVDKRQYAHIDSADFAKSSDALLQQWRQVFQGQG